MMGVETGHYATSRRGMCADDEAFIRTKIRQKVPLGAVARMAGRPLSDVQIVLDAMRRGRPNPPIRRPAPEIIREPIEPPEPDYGGQEVLSLFRGLIFIPPKRRTMREIAEDVARRYCVHVDDLRSDSRVRWLAWPRQEAFALCKATGLFSYPQIGQFFGDRDHTTVLYGERAYKKRLAKAMAVAAE